MLEILLVIAVCTAFCCGRRYSRLKRSIWETNKELAEITQQIEENRILKLRAPQREMEALLVTLNQTLEQVRAERIAFEVREREFQRQLEDISHDLRTPLTAIQGCLKLIDQENLDSGEREYLEVVQRRSAHLRHLIEQFYEFSVLLSGDDRMELRQVDLARMCREQVLGYYRQLEGAGIEVRIRIPEKPVFIQADENALSRIIGNLLQNAVRYAKHLLEVEVRDAESTGEAPALIFANDAENLTREDVRRMFDRFYTGDPARSQGGTGLGLAISRRLAEQMGAVMTAKCREAEGCAEGETNVHGRIMAGSPTEAHGTENGRLRPCMRLTLTTIFQGGNP